MTVVFSFSVSPISAHTNRVEDHANIITGEDGADSSSSVGGSPKPKT